jgi:hypothetical protein
MEYYGLNSPAEAVMFICKKFGFKNTDDMITEGLKDVKKKVNLQKKAECTHIIASSQCRTLLRKNYDKYSKWVAEAYQKMNKALDSDDIETIESVGFEASNKMGEK